MNKYNYGNRSFKTKKEIQQAISKFLNDTPCHTIIDHNEENEWIYALFETHPRALEKLANMEYLIIKNDMTHKTKCFFICNHDNTIEDISYRKCLFGETNKHNAIKSFRDDIAYQIIEFRHNLFNENKTIICEETGKILENNKFTHIDHNYRKITFITLVRMLCEQYNINLNTLESVSIGTTKTIKNDIIRNNWIEYHKNNAILRAIYYKNNLEHTQYWSH